MAGRFMSALMLVLAIWAAPTLAGGKYWEVKNYRTYRPQVGGCLATVAKHCPLFAGLVYSKSTYLTALLNNCTAEVTILCPTDNAIKKANIPKGVSVEDVLKYHVIPKKSLCLSELAGSRTPLATAYQNKTLTTKVQTKKLFIYGSSNKARVIAGDFKCAKGYVHQIDLVLIPKVPKPSVPAPKPCASPSPSPCYVTPPVSVSSPPPACKSPPPSPCYVTPPVSASSPPPACKSPPPSPCYVTPPVSVSSPPPACTSPPPSPCYVIPPVSASSPPPTCASPPPPSPCPIASPPPPSPCPVASPPPPSPCPVASPPPPSPCPVASPPPPSPCPVASPPPPSPCPIASPPPPSPCYDSPPPPSPCYDSPPPPSPCYDFPPPPSPCYDSPSPPPPCASPPPPCDTPDCTTIYATISSNPELSIFKQIVDSAYFQLIFNDPNNFGTVLVPTNSAFNNLCSTLGTDLNTLLGNTKLLMSIITNHIVPGVAVRSTQLSDGLSLMTYGHKFLFVSNKDGVITFRSDGTAQCIGVVRADITACKSIVHIIDGVLVPAGAY